MVKIKLVDVSTFEDAVFEIITKGGFDPEKFELVRGGRGASEEEFCGLVGDADVIFPIRFMSSP